MQAVVSASANKPLRMQVERKDEIITLNITPQESGLSNLGTPIVGRGQIGVGFGEVAPILTVLSPKSKLTLMVSYRRYSERSSLQIT